MLYSAIKSALVIVNYSLKKPAAINSRLLDRHFFFATLSPMFIIKRL